MVRILITIFLMFLIGGCGHTVIRTDRGTGTMARIPLPDGSSLIEVKFGKLDSITAVLRGGSSFSSGSSTGGSILGTGGTSDNFQVYTIPQLNEGYMANVMISPEVPAEVKIKLADYMTKSKPNQPSSFKSVSIGSAVASGKNSHEIKPEAVGLDNVVNKTAEAIPKVTRDASRMVKDTRMTVKDITSTFRKWWYIAVVAVVLIAVLIFSFGKKKKKSEVFIFKNFR